MGDDGRAGWLVVLGGVLIMLMLGVTYTWSVFAGPLSEKYGWSQVEVQLAFSIMLASFALSMIPAGIIQDRKGPRVVALIGGILLGLGFVTTGLYASTPLALYITYGILAGAGVGFAYVTPIAASVKWFEKKKGLVSGVIVFGFGFGSLLLAPVAKELVASQGISQAFIILGVAFAIIISAGAFLLKNPPESAPGKVASGGNDILPGQLIRSSSFWTLWVMFAFAAAAGLTVIGNLATFAKLSFMTIHGMDTGAAVSLAALAVGALAILNGGGRIFAGWLSDRIGRAKTLLIMNSLQTILLITLIPASGVSQWVLFVWMGLIGMCFGANLALFPSITADFFGTKHMGVNYGLMFTAYGFGGILGPQIMAYLLDTAKAAKGSLSVGDYSLPLMLLAFLVAVSAVLSLSAKNPSKKA